MEIEPPGESKNIADARLAIVRLIEPLAHPHNSLALPLTDVGPRGFGHWRLKVCKHGSFNLTSSEPL